MPSVCIHEAPLPGVEAPRHHSEEKVTPSEQTAVEMESALESQGGATTGASTPDSADIKVDIDYAAHFEQLNRALRLTPTLKDLSIATEGGPENFGVVMKGVYRSGFPKKDEYSFIHKLKLKTVLTLVKKEDDPIYTSFLASNKIEHHVIDMKGTKKETISLSMMRQIIGIVLDKSNYPMLVHCNRGRHRTGCVVGVIRKLSNWNLAHILAEYRNYAQPKVREMDINYLTSFDITHLPNYFHTAPVSTLIGAARHVVLLEGFLRMVAFVCLVLGLWFITLITGKKIDVNVTEFLELVSIPSLVPDITEEEN